MAARNGVSTHVTQSASLFLAFSGLGCQKKKKVSGCLCFGCWLQGTDFVVGCVYLCGELMDFNSPGGHFPRAVSGSRLGFRPNVGM